MSGGHDLIAYGCHLRIALRLDVGEDVAGKSGTNLNEESGVVDVQSRTIGRQTGFQSGGDPRPQRTSQVGRSEKNDFRPHFFDQPDDVIFVI